MSVADLGFNMGGGSIMIFETTPTFALTTPIFDRKWRAVSSLLPLKAASSPEFAQEHL